MQRYIPLNVLVIDDDPINNFIFNKITRKVAPNASVAFCLNGEEAIDHLLTIIRENDKPFPDLIFLDLAMPVMNGWEFLEEYQRLDLENIVAAKIYITTSSIFEQDIERALNYAIVKDFISKPISLDRLEKILD